MVNKQSKKKKEKKKQREKKNLVPESATYIVKIRQSSLDAQNTYQQKYFVQNPKIPTILTKIQPNPFIFLR
jgi:hypothetical protein